ncbi:hypothetical protein [Fusobacterium ulcerans]|uniref:hypothetical protein n=1 Tax=Fusobacterium ulcerans TaxID=861 RepID=UPI00241CBE81|nr:hypothetical protein [Fusobacterium ulcerans]
MEISLKEFYFLLKKIEEQEELFEMKIQNVYFWKIIRFKLYNEMLFKLGISEKKNEKNKLSKIKYLYDIILTTVKKNNNKKDVLFLEPGRVFYEEGKIKSIYFYEIIEKIEDKKISYDIFYFNEYGKTAKKIKNIKYDKNIWYVFYKIYFFMKKIKISFAEEEELKRIRTKLSLKIKVENIDVLEKINVEKIITRYKEDYYYYTKLFKEKELKRIYLVCSYGKEGLISAALDLGIKVIELQHGIINKYCSGYNFYNNKFIHYIPNEIYLFGKYWAEFKNFPKNLKKEIYGYPYLKKQLLKYKNIDKKLDQVIFISQWLIGKKLSEKAVEFALNNSEIKVIFRLHPIEFTYWKREYKKLFKYSNLKNLEVSDSNNKNLYEYLTESKYLISTGSTVVYEALELGLKVGIIKLTNWEYMEELIKNNIVHLFEENEIVDLKKLGELKDLEKGYFFK